MMAASHLSPKSRVEHALTLIVGVVIILWGRLPPRSKLSGFLANVDRYSSLSWLFQVAIDTPPALRHFLTSSRWSDNSTTSMSPVSAASCNDAFCFGYLHRPCTRATHRAERRVSYYYDRQFPATLSLNTDHLPSLQPIVGSYSYSYGLGPRPCPGRVQYDAYSRVRCDPSPRLSAY